MNCEQATHKMLTRCSVLDVLSTQLALFTEQYGHMPELVLVERSLRGAFIRALQRELDVPAGMTVAEPFWFDSTPVLFKKMSETFMVLRSIQTQRENRL